MEGKTLWQSSRKRACEDTKRFFHSLKFFWVVEVVLMVGFGFLGHYLIPEGASKIVSAAYPAIGAIVGAVAGFGIIYLIMFFAAPYKQRNDARARIRKLEESLGMKGYIEAFMWEGLEELHKLKLSKSHNLPIDEHHLKLYRDWFKDVSDWLHKNMYSEVVNWHRKVDVGLLKPTIDDIIHSYELGLDFLGDINKAIELAADKRGSQN